jgi:MFS superfamily sulfate permease-like transporter
LDLGASADLDIGTSDMLRDLTSDLRQASIDLLFAQVRGSVRQRMRVTGLFDHIGEDHVFLSVAAAVSDFEQRNQ